MSFRQDAILGSAERIGEYVRVLTPRESDQEEGNFSAVRRIQIPANNTEITEQDR
jgi:hypothetical protein